MDDLFDQPSTSKEAAERLQTENLSDETLHLNIQDEEAEIAALRINDGEETEAQTEMEEDERIAKIEFRCCCCDMKEMVHHFGKSPDFVTGIQFIEDTFVMRDPFQPPPPRWKRKPEYFVAMGANCVKCQRAVCKGSQCSFFYTRTYCLRCAEDNIKQFPMEVQTKLRKQLTAK